MLNDLYSFSLIGAYIAGLTSFLAPCLLPLLPSYFSAISGFTFKDLYGMEFHHIKSRVIAGSIFFVTGFSLIYAILGGLGTLLGQAALDYLNYILRVSGLILIFLGLMQVGIIHFNSLNFDYAWNIQRKLTKLGYLTSVITGMIAALSWMPCISPTLTPILLIASTKDSVLEGIFLLFIFSLGIGTPFIIAGLFFPQAIKFIQKYRKILHFFSIIAGFIMIAFGILLLSDYYQWFIGLINSMFTRYTKL